MSDLSPAEAMSEPSLRVRIESYFPKGQMVRYLCVGAFNTAFGYGTFSLLNWLLFRAHVPASYIFALVFGNFINITVAFLGYKWFVFRTHGNYLREWAKALAVYTTSLLPALVLLPLLVHLFEQFTKLGNKSPYIANAILTVFGVVYNFIGHKSFTFRNQNPA
jgi:putative flippase GtrA